MNYIDSAREVIDCEIAALEVLKSTLDERFSETVELMHAAHGKIVVTGVGKSGHIGRKIAATLSSLGTPSFFLHPDDAMHGDLGMVSKEDTVLAISNSGESEELVRIVPNIKMIGAKLVAVTSNSESHLAKYADVICPIPKVEEACHIGMAPTSSTTVTLVLGDAIAIILSDILRFKEENFSIFHPAGVLGRRLTTRVSDVMHKGAENAVIPAGSTIKETLFEIAAKGFGATSVVDEMNHLAGFVTDGDIRRSMEKEISLSCSVDEIMTRTPVTIHETALAVDALILMQEGGKRLSSLPVVNDEEEFVGILTAVDILRLGILY